MQCDSSTSSWGGFYGSGRSRTPWIHFLHSCLTIHLVGVTGLACQGMVSSVICGPMMTGKHAKNMWVHDWKLGISRVFCAIGRGKANLDFWATFILSTKHSRDDLLWRSEITIYIYICVCVCVWVCVYIYMHEFIRLSK